MCIYLHTHTYIHELQHKTETTRFRYIAGSRKYSDNNLCQTRRFGVRIICYEIKGASSYAKVSIRSHACMQSSKNLVFSANVFFHNSCLGLQLKMTRGVHYTGNKPLRARACMHLVFCNQTMMCFLSFSSGHFRAICGLRTTRGAARLPFVSTLHLDQPRRGHSALFE
jgi:hypothetical protein